MSSPRGDGGEASGLPIAVRYEIAIAVISGSIAKSRHSSQLAVMPTHSARARGAGSDAERSGEVSRMRIGCSFVMPSRRAISVPAYRGDSAHPMRDPADHLRGMRVPPERQAAPPASGSVISPAVSGAACRP